MGGPFSFLVLLTSVISMLVKPSLQTFECKYSLLRDFGGRNNVIVSPNYPLEYPPNTCLVWIYTGHPDTVFTLRMLEIDMPGRTGACLKDRDSVLVGPVPKKRFCGHSPLVDQVYRATLTQENSVVYIMFNSTASPAKGRGFKAEYRLSRPSGAIRGSLTQNGSLVKPTSNALSNSTRPSHPSVSQHSCYHEVRGVKGEIFLNNLLLQQFRRTGVCSWHVQSSAKGQAGQVKIKLWFRNCGFGSSNLLTVLDTDNTVIRRLTDRRCPQFVVSKGNGITVQLIHQKRSDLEGDMGISLVLYYHTELGSDHRDNSAPAVKSTLESPLPGNVDNQIDLLPYQPVVVATDCNQVLRNESLGEIFGPVGSPGFMKVCSGQQTWLVEAQALRLTSPRATVRFRLTLDVCPLGQGFSRGRVQVFDGRNSSAPLLLSCDEHNGHSSQQKYTSTDSFFVLFHSSVRNMSQAFHLLFERQVQCLEGYMKCTGEDLCYPPTARCNGSWECPRHGGDELNCDLIRCPPGTYSCKIGSQYCFDESDRCNGKGTCGNYMDEMNCDASMCNPDKGLFLCKNSRCIYEKWRCDGTSDCKDGSDEEGCGTVMTPRMTVAAVIGSLTCSLLLVVAVGCVCKVYRLRLRQLSPGGGSNGAPCCAAHGRHESPLSRQLAEMFRQRAPPPPYHEAMLTSRPYREMSTLEGEGDVGAEMEAMSRGDNGVDPGTGTGAAGRRGPSRSQRRRRPAGDGGGGRGSTDAETAQNPQVSTYTNSRRTRRSRRQHRAVNQQSLAPPAPSPGQPSTGFIEVGSLTHLGCGVAGHAGMDEPPPYSLSDPATMVAEGIAGEAGGQAGPLSDVDPQGLESLTLRQQRQPLGRSEGRRGDNPSCFEMSSVSRGSNSQGRDCHPLHQQSTGGESEPGLCADNGYAKNDGDGDGEMCAGTELCGNSFSEPSPALLVHGRSRARAEDDLVVMEEDSDSDCILSGDNNNEDKDDNEDDNDDDDEEEEEEDDDVGDDFDEESDDSDTACLLSAV